MQVEIDIPDEVEIVVDQIPLGAPLILNHQMFLDAIRSKHAEFFQLVRRAVIEFHFGDEHIARWNRVMNVFHREGSIMTSTEAAKYEKQDKRWAQVVRVLKDIEDVAKKHKISR